MYENNEPYNFSTDPNKNGNTENTEEKALSESSGSTNGDSANTENTIYGSGNRQNEQYGQQTEGQWNAYGQNPYNAYNQQNGQYQYQSYPGQPPLPEKVNAKSKKKSGGGLVAGLLVAALVIGGVGGFGGSYLARRLDNNSIVSGEQDNKPNGTEPDGTKPNGSKPESENFATEEGLITAPEYVKPENQVQNDLSGLQNMAEINSTEEYTYAELYQKVNESIVVVTNYVDAGNGEFEKYGTGSGVIFTTDGYVVTNYHVIAGAGRISVTVDDKISENTEMEAVLVGSDSATDLAILKIAREQPFAAAALGDSDTLVPGQVVCALGAPLGLEKSISNGIVSGLNRYADSKGYVLSSIQTTAAINPGNSGGGLFDMYGNVVGVVNSKLVKVDEGATTTESLGFAITINEAKPIMSDLINYGHVKGRPMLGISAHEVTDYEAQIYGLPAMGLLVAKIDQNAPAARSDLQMGDIITHINGTEVITLEDVQDIIKNMKGGDVIQVTVIRTKTESAGYFSQTSYDEHTFDLELTETE